MLIRPAQSYFNKHSFQLALVHTDIIPVWGEKLPAWKGVSLQVSLPCSRADRVSDNAELNSIPFPEGPILKATS